jgi:RND superfamily putative drug exporter
VTAPVLNKAGDTAVMTVIPRSGPSAAATEDLIRAIREQNGSVPGAQIGVTGLTAVNIDVSAKLGAALLPYLAIVVGLAFVLLTLVFRSLLVPLKATLGFLLSILATFGAVVAVFQWGWAAGLLGVDQTGPIISFLPIILVGIVFGLAMDYQVFLVTRIREEFVHGADPKDAVVNGFGHGARVVTAAAIIMISVFSGFILSPESIIKSIGFALGVAVPLRCGRGPDDHRAGGHDPARPLGLVATALAGQAAAGCRRGGGEAHTAARRRSRSPGPGRAVAGLTDLAPSSPAGPDPVSA